MIVLIDIVKKLFWIALAALPEITDYLVTMFIVNSCMPGTECLNHAMPLIVDVGIITLVEMLLVWPDSLWFLGGRWVYSKSRSSIRKSA